MKKEKYWAIVCQNFHGDDDIYYFTSYEVAKQNFDRIVEKYQDEDEFECNDNSCTWFDDSYNEFDTFINLLEKPMPKIYNNIIF